MKNRGNMIFAMVMVAVIAIALVVMVVVKNQSEDNNVDKSNPTKANIDIKGQPMLGKKDAPVTIVEFGDYKCPACKYFDMEMQPELMKKYIDKGDVNMYFINTPFHGGESMLGALAAETVWKHEPEKYWEFHNALFEAQPQEHATEDKWLTNKVIEKAMKQAGIKDTAKLMKAIDNSEEEKAVSDDVALYQKHNVTMTPTLYVNGEYVTDPMQMDEVVKAIEDAKK